MLAPGETLKPTAEQEHIIALSESSDANLMINALAGSGKTSTLEMIQRAVKTKPILYLCFNKKIAQEAEKKFPSTTSVRTLNSIGHRIWARDRGSNLSLNDKKTREILRSIIDDSPKHIQSTMWDCYWEVLNAVALAKALGYIPPKAPKHENSLCTWEELNGRLDEKADDLVEGLTDEVLCRSIRSAYEGHIDFNDQVYMPALFGGTFPSFPLVAVDEAQDLNPVNHRMVRKLSKQRLMAVGDPYQSIYGFRGAVQSGMQKLKDAHQMTETDLSVSFRCPQAVVEHARWRVPSFKWIKEGGHAEKLGRISLDNIPDDATVICRNNAPLFRLGLRFLSAGRSVSISGSDIGPRIVGIMKKLGHDDMSQPALLGKILEWEDEKLSKESKTAKDIADCMRVFASFGSNLSQAIAHAEHLFAQRGAIKMMTGHKSKGLEFPLVYHLDPWLCSDEEQDLNLRYVITTRSMDTLYEVNSKDIQ